MKKRVASWLLCLALLVPLISATVYADCGPKPSIHVKAETEETVYVAILSPYDRYGPSSVITKEDVPDSWRDVSDQAWAAFRDADYGVDAYFCGHAGLGGTSWTYICPDEFRIAIYCPAYETVIVSSQVFRTYAFRSDFHLDLSGLDLTASGMAEMKLHKQVEYGKLIGGFLLRAALTLIIELAVAFLFGYRSREFIKTVLVVNLVTQVGLNALLSLWYFADGPLDALLRLALAEVVVLVTESILYARKLRSENRGAGRAVLYALAANLASVIIGWHLID